MKAKINRYDPEYEFFDYVEAPNGSMMYASEVVPVVERIESQLAEAVELLAYFKGEVISICGEWCHGKPGPEEEACPKCELFSAMQKADAFVAMNGGESNV